MWLEVNVMLCEVGEHVILSNGHSQMMKNYSEKEKW